MQAPISRFVSTRRSRKFVFLLWLTIPAACIGQPEQTECVRLEDAELERIKAEIDDAIDSDEQWNAFDSFRTQNLEKLKLIFATQSGFEYTWDGGAWEPVTNTVNARLFYFPGDVVLRETWSSKDSLVQYSLTGLGFQYRVKTKENTEDVPRVVSGSLGNQWQLETGSNDTDFSSNTTMTAEFPGGRFTSASGDSIALSGGSSRKWLEYDLATFRIVASYTMKGSLGSVSTEIDVTVNGEPRCGGAFHVLAGAFPSVSQRLSLFE